MMNKGTAGSPTKERQSIKEVSACKQETGGKSKKNAQAVKKNAQAVKNTQAVKKNAQAVKNTQAVKKNAQAVKNTQPVKNNAHAGKKNTQAVKNAKVEKKNAKSVKKKNAQAVKKNAQTVKENAQDVKENAHPVKKNAHPVKKNAHPVKKISQAVRKNAQAVKKNAQAMKNSCKTSTAKTKADSVKCKKLIQPCDEILCHDEKESSEANDVEGSSTQGKDKGRRKQLKPRKSQTNAASDNTNTPSLVNGLENSLKRNNLKEEEAVLDKKTRGKRRKRKSEIYDLGFLEDEDIDIDYDSSADDYRPPKDYDDDMTDEYEEGNMVNKKKRFKQLKIEKQSEKKMGMKKGKKNNGGIHKASESAADGIKRAKKKWIEKVKIDVSSHTHSFVDMPNIISDDFSTKATVSTKKRKRKPQSHVSKKKSDLDEIIDWEKDVDDDDDDDDDDEDEDDPEERDEDADLDQDDRLTKTKKNSRHGQPYSVTGNWYIASGYLQDLTSLLEAFEKTDGWKFKNFSLCWQELQFSLIFRGRQNFKELLEFSEEVALLTKRFLVPPHNLKWRVGALYTIYGLYYKHPFRHFFKIRLIRDEYEQLLKLADQFRSDVDNPDPAYIFRKMEVEGAFHHVATSSEMCLDLYSMEREEVDIKYESQRLVNASPVSAVLSVDSRFIDDCVLQQYNKIKAYVMGDGKEPERAVSLVQPSLPLEIDNALKDLKEDILIQLGLKESPSKIAAQNQNQNELSHIGTRRAHIRAKAVAVDTSEEYLKKKGLVGGFYFTGKTGRLLQKKRRGRPAKRNMEENIDNEGAISCNNENETGRLSKKSGRNGNKASREVIKSPKMLMDKNVRRFMSPPSAGTLRIPLKPRKKAKLSSKKVTYSTEGEESGLGSESEVDKEHAVDEPQEQMELETSKCETMSSSFTDLDYEEEEFNAVPQVSPPPKRKRGRPRKNVLYKALEVSQGSSPPKEKVPSVFVGQKVKLNKYLKDMLKTQRSDNNPTVINTLDAVQINSHIIDLPAEETSIILPMQREGTNDESSAGSSLCKLDTAPYAQCTKGNNPLLAQDSTKDSICLDVQFNKKGTNIIRKMKFKVKTKVWESIENDRVKIENLKKKLLQLLPNENQSEEGKVNIVTQISASVTEGNMDTAELSQSFSPQDENPKLQSSSTQFQHSRKTNKQIRAVKEVNSGSCPLLSTREKGRGITRPGVGKMLMVPIKIGGFTHYLPASSSTKRNDKGIEQINDESSLVPAVKREVPEVTPIVDNYQIPQSNETLEAPRKLADDIRAESPDFISSDMNWVNPLPENEISYILSSSPIKEDIYNGVDEITPIRRREYTCRTGASHSTQTNDETPNRLWELKSNRERPPESNTELEVLTLHDKNHSQRVLDTMSAQCSSNKPFIRKDQVHKACKASTGKTLEIMVSTKRNLSLNAENNCYDDSQSTSIEEINCPEATEITNLEEINYSNEDEDQIDCVGVVVDDIVNGMTSFVSPIQSSDVAGSSLEPVSRGMFYVPNAKSRHVEKDISQAPVVSTVTPAELTFNIYPSETSGCANYTVIPNETTSLTLPCTSMAPLVREELNLRAPLQSRQVQMSPPVMENVMIPISEGQVIVQSSPQQITMSTASPLAVSTPISSWHAAEHISLEDVLSASTPSSHGSPHSTPGWIHKSPHERIRPLSTTPLTTHYPDCPISMVTYQKVPVQPLGNSPSKFPEHQPAQQSMLEITPPRYSEVVEVSQASVSSPSMHQSSSISTPVIYPHNPQSDSMMGLRRLPDIMGSKLLKVKINDKTVFVPADRVLTSATRVTYATQLANESETLVEKEDISHGSVQVGYNRSVGPQELNSNIPSQGTVVDGKRIEKVESEILSIPRILTDNQHTPPSSSSAAVNVSGLNCEIKTEDVKPFESCSKTVESKTEASSPKLSSFRNTQVCSFLFSPKYKALSGLKETLGPATGTPVIPKKSRVPFLLKQSLVPKKKF